MNWSVSVHVPGQWITALIVQPISTQRNPGILPLQCIHMIETLPQGIMNKIRKNKSCQIMHMSILSITEQ